MLSLETPFLPAGQNYLNFKQKLILGDSSCFCRIWFWFCELSLVFLSLLAEFFREPAAIIQKYIKEEWLKGKEATTNIHKVLTLDVDCNSQSKVKGILILTLQITS